MGEVIHVQFGLEREWEYTRAKTIAGLVSVGAVYGDSEELMTAKAERVLELLRVIVEQIPPVTVTTRLPDGLTDEQIRVLTEAIKKATLHGFESAMTHSVQAFMSAIYDLCTSKLRESQ